MSTLQNTISMMETLPETDLIKIQNFTKKLSQRRELERGDFDYSSQNTARPYY